MDEQEKTEADVKFKFYDNAKQYWTGVPPTIDGMLGGFGCISNTDIRGSEMFLKKVFSLKHKPGHRRALDCGAGIGRITKNLLVKYFDRVDLLEQNPKFLNVAEQFLIQEKKIGVFYNAGLQNFEPEARCYDVIWCQWVLGHLTDDDLVTFMNRCKNGLSRNGIIIIKENIASQEVVFDEEDSSVTRPLQHYLDLFQKANLEILRHSKQANFPRQLFKVQIFALQPKTEKFLVHEGQENINDIDNGRSNRECLQGDVIQQLGVIQISNNIKM